MTEQTERERVVAWLNEQSERVLDEMPEARWAIILWSIRHHIKFLIAAAVCRALTNAARAIEAGDHLKGTTDD
jgi:hypothetical protein